jgi:hypothetical protein
MLREDAHAPFGIETDMEAFAEALDVVISDSADSTGPSFIVLDAGDAYRATKFETQVTEEIALRHRQNALTTLDRVVTLARERFPDDVIILASQSTGDPAMGRLEGFGPIVISGGDRSGFLSSSSTQRAGLVTNLDLTATVLDALGLKRPVQVLGNEMVLGAAPARLEDRVRVLDRLNRTAVSVDSGKPGVVNTFVVFTVIVLALSAIVLVRSRYWSPGLTAGWLLALRSALLLTIAVPVSSWMQFLWWRWPATATQAVTALAITSAVVWIASVAVMRFFPGRLAVAFGCLLTTLVLLVDQFFGAPLSFTNFFGYSPLMAARFYGMGNEAAAMFFGASVVGAALVLDEWPRARLVPLAKRIGLPVFGVLVVVVSAAPFLGANVGVVAWGTVGFAVAWVLMNGYRFTWRTALLILAAIVALTLAFALFDIFAAGQQTHLARSLGSAADGGLVELWKIVVRKADTNVRVLTHTRWSYILIAVVAFLAFARWRPQGDFAATLDENPHFADAITVSLVAGLAAYFTEDSGIVIPALEVLYLGVALAWVMLARLDRGETR